MAHVITIVADATLTYALDGGDTTILCKWICDKHQDRVFIKDAFGFPPIDLGKISATNIVTVDTVEYTDPTLARAAIGANW